jgi:hypothetical protein
MRIYRSTNGIAGSAKWSADAAHWRIANVSKFCAEPNPQWRLNMLMDSPTPFVMDFSKQPTADEVAEFIAQSDWNYAGNWPGFRSSLGGKCTNEWLKTTGSLPLVKPHHNPKPSKTNILG